MLIFQKTRQGDVCLMIQQTRLGLFPLNVEDELPLITIVGGGPSWKRSCVEEASVWDGISPHKIVLISFPVKCYEGVSDSTVPIAKTHAWIGLRSRLTSDSR